MNTLLTMERGFITVILLSVGVFAQTKDITEFIHDVYTEVSVPQSQLETTQIVQHPTSISTNIQSRVMAQKNVTRCAELSIDPCPEPELLVTVSAVSNYNKTYSYSKTITGEFILVTNIDDEVDFTTESRGAEEGQLLLVLNYNIHGSFNNLQTDGNYSTFTVKLRTKTTALPNNENSPSGSGPGSGSRNGQPALSDHGGLFGFMALMLLSTFLLG